MNKWKRRAESLRMALDEADDAFRRAFDRARKAEAENDRLRRLSVRIFDECGNGTDHPDCSYSAVCINGYLHCNKCGLIEKDAACDGKGMVLRDEVVHWRRLYDKVEMVAFPASWMEAENG